MKCFECDKELQGGFGVGEPPYEKYRCAACVIRNVENEHGTFLVGEIRKELQNRPRLEGRRYAAYKRDVEKLLDRLEAWSCLIERAR